MKRCYRCKTYKSITAFYKNASKPDGLKSECKPCALLSLVATRAKRPEHYRTYARKYQRERVPMEYKIRLAREYRARHPEQVIAHQIVKKALYHGVITKQPCVVCDSTINVQAHHWDYAEPMEFVWLCPWHHKNVYKLLAEVQQVA